LATKWKNKIRSSIWIVLLTFGLSGLTTFFTLGSSYVYGDYFETPAFQYKLNQFAINLNRFELNSISVEQAKELVNVTKDDIEQYRYQLGNLTYQLEALSTEYDPLILEAVAMDNQEAANFYTAERDKKIEETKKEFTNDKFIEEKIIQNKEKELTDFFREQDSYRTKFLIERETFQYYFKNTSTGKVYTNLPHPADGPITDGMIASDKLFITSYSIPREYSMQYSIPTGYSELYDSFTSFEGQIAVSKGLSPSNELRIESERYKLKQMIWIVYTLLGIVALIVCIYLNKKKSIFSEMGAWITYYHKVPIDVRIFIFIITGVVAVQLPFRISGQMFKHHENLFVYGQDLFIDFTLGTIFMGLMIVQGVLLLRIFRDRQRIKESWESTLILTAIKGIYRKLIQLSKGIQAILHRAIGGVRDAFIIKSMGVQLLIMLLFVFGLGIAGMMITIDPVFSIFYIILLVFIGIPVSVILFKHVGYFNQIFIKMNELATGNLGHELPVSGKSVLGSLAGNVNVLRQGVKTSQNEQAKSERLKTELITNVSHDLRTPLTSIITYTDLLRMDGVSDEERSAYLEIIDRKSKRLKVLIDDLFEVSKMASGNMELNRVKVDLVQLLQQTLAEHDNTITDSNLQFRVSYAEMPVYALVDGNKLWRVFDNLIENALKYSLEHSRVYIAVRATDHRAVVSFKNVSRFELAEHSDELFERFKRGDTSRQTEGSGLGLAIAKSIVDLHEGSLEIETEGDLFKVNISLALLE